MNFPQLDRLKLVKAAVELNGDLKSLEKKLANYPWDFDGDPVLLDKKFLQTVLARYLNGALMADEVWEFLPGTIVRSGFMDSDKGDKFLAALESVENERN